MLSVSLIAFLTYVPILGYYFTGADTFTLIETSRIQSMRDILAIFTQPLMNETIFSQYALYYRPITSLSFALDYYFWGLNPFGYHLTDLILHIIVSVLVFITMFFVLNYEKAISWTSAVIFTTHPILVESVPAIARRQDIITATFLLLSLLFFWKHSSKFRVQTYWFLFFSVIFYALALGSKEIAILFPILLSIYLFIGRIPDEKNKFDFLKTRVFLIAPYALLSLIYVVWRTYILHGIGGAWADTPYRTITKLFFADLIYPTVSDIGGRRFVILFALFCVFLFILLIAKQVFTSYEKKTIIFLLAWLVLPLLIYLATHTFSHRLMYIPAIPFSSILAIGLVQSFRFLFCKSTSKAATSMSRLWNTVSMLFVFTFSSSLSLYLLLFSPLFQDYTQWESSGEISRIITGKLPTVVDKLPNQIPYSLHLYDFPSGITKEKEKTPYVKSVSYLYDYSVKSYLRLTNPEKQIEVVVVNNKKLPVNSKDIILDIRIDDSDNNILITFKPH